MTIEENFELFLHSKKTPAKIAHAVLAVLMLSGVLVIGAMAPNAFLVFRNYGKTKKYSKKQLQSSLDGLERHGFVKIKRRVKDGSCEVKLTSKGKSRVKKLSLQTLAIPAQKIWDKKWRMVIFDVPVKYNAAREALRRKLRELNFFQLQKSVWAYPYPCEDEILFIAHMFSVEPYIDVFTAEDFLHEDKLRKYFDL